MAVEFIGKTKSGNRIYLVEEIKDERDLTELVIGEMNKGEFDKIREIKSAEMKSEYCQASQLCHYEGTKIENIIIAGDFVQFEEAHVVEEDDKSTGSCGKRNPISRSAVSFRYDTLNDMLEKSG